VKIPKKTFNSAVKTEPKENNVVSYEDVKIPKKTFGDNAVKRENDAYSRIKAEDSK